MDDESPCLFCGLPCDWAEFTVTTLEELEKMPWTAVSFTNPEHENRWCCDVCYFARKHDSLPPGEAARIDFAWVESFGPNAPAVDPLKAEALREAAEGPHEYFSSGSRETAPEEEDCSEQPRCPSERAQDPPA